MDKFGLISGFRPQTTPKLGSGAKAVKALLGLVGFVGGIFAGIYMYRRSSSWALAIYAFTLVTYVVGRALGDILVEPQRVKRTLYFAIPALTATGVLYITHRWWDIWWLAVVLGILVGGAIIGGILGTVLFPGIAQDEAKDSKERTKQSLGL